MAKTTAPLMAFGASGQIANALVFGNWKGQGYARRYVTPANPQSADQTATRSVFTWASNVWKQAGPLLRAPWDRYAVGQILTGRNHFIGRQIVNLRGDADLTDFQGSPGAKGGLAPSTFSAAAGVGQITGTFTTPTAPTGWTLQAAVMAVIADQDPSSGTIYESGEGEDTAAPMDTVVVTGLDTVLHQCEGWLRWLKPDGSVAYGPSLSDTATPT